ncbi:MAG: hypothetical protein K2X90_04025 [Candidatus Babeliaceae bacterium]|nr:hypothetical protein [Candidatus Babeliaceae bacterium]
MNYTKLLFASFGFAACFNITSKVLIITHAYNRPEFIPLQDSTFKKFLKDDYEFVVFNDARDPKVKKEIYEICKKLNLRCIRIHQEIHDRPYLYRWPGEDYNSACCRCANVVQYSLNEIGFQHNDLVAIVDSDLFLIKEFSIREYMKNCQLAGIEQKRHHVDYLWNGIVFFDMPNLPSKKEIDFNCGKVDGIPVDVGGQIYHYLKKHPNLSVKYINQWHTDDFTENHDTLIKNGLNEKTLSFYDIKIPNAVFILDSTFLHYQSGTNWNRNSPEYHRTKFKKLEAFINHIIS